MGDVRRTLFFNNITVLGDVRRTLFMNNRTVLGDVGGILLNSDFHHLSFKGTGYKIL